MTELTTKILTEIRDEQREFRAETHANFTQIFHRPALLETKMGGLETKTGALETKMGAFETKTGGLEGEMKQVKERLTSIERHMAALLATVPVVTSASTGWRRA